MWSPRPEQAARLAALWRHLSPAIASIWHDSVADERGQRIWQLQNRAMWAPEFAHLRDETVRQVAARVPAADPAWADMGRLGDWSVRSLVGGRWLVKACEHIERHGLAIVRASQLRGIEGICGDLARIGAVPADERAATVDALRRMQPATLLMVLPLETRCPSAVDIASYVCFHKLVRYLRHWLLQPSRALESTA